MSLRENIISQLKVLPKIDPDWEVQRRISFIQSKLQQANSHTLVLGISGGVDSSLCGKLAQLAVEDLRQKTQQAYQFIAVRLPYGVQHDEADAQRALAFIQPDCCLSVNIQGAADALHQSVQAAIAEQTCQPVHSQRADFIKGNNKARQRMIAQYEIAALFGGLVLGTDHSAENLTGFYTKWGDGACDLAPLYGLNKRQVRQLACHLGAAPEIANKIPTADLESQRPQLPDEEALGISYEVIDDFLEGKTIAADIEQRLLAIFQRTEHKRQAIPTVYDNE